MIGAKQEAFFLSLVPSSSGAPTGQRKGADVDLYLVADCLQQVEQHFPEPGEEPVVVNEIILDCRKKAAGVIRSPFTEDIRAIIASTRKKLISKVSYSDRETEGNNYEHGERHFHLLMELLGTWSNIIMQISGLGLSLDTVHQVILPLHSHVIDCAVECFLQFKKDKRLDSWHERVMSRDENVRASFSLVTLDSIVQQVASIREVVGQYYSFLDDYSIVHQEQQDSNSSNSNSNSKVVTTTVKKVYPEDELYSWRELDMIYISIESGYLSCAVHAALEEVQLVEIQTGMYVPQLIEDIFFIFNRVLERSISTSVESIVMAIAMKIIYYLDYDAMMDVGSGDLLEGEDMPYPIYSLMSARDCFNSAYKIKSIRKFVEVEALNREASHDHGNEMKYKEGSRTGKLTGKLTGTGSNAESGSVNKDKDGEGEEENENESADGLKTGNGDYPSSQSQVRTGGGAGFKENITEELHALSHSLGISTKLADKAVDKVGAFGSALTGVWGSFTRTSTAAAVSTEVPKVGGDGSHFNHSDSDPKAEAVGPSSGNGSASNSMDDFFAALEADAGVGPSYPSSGDSNNIDPHSGINSSDALNEMESANSNGNGNNAMKKKACDPILHYDAFYPSKNVVVEGYNDILSALSTVSEVLLTTNYEEKDVEAEYKRDYTPVGGGGGSTADKFIGSLSLGDWAVQLNTISATGACVRHLQSSYSTILQGAQAYEKTLTLIGAELMRVSQLYDKLLKDNLDCLLWESFEKHLAQPLSMHCIARIRAQRGGKGGIGAKLGQQSMHQQSMSMQSVNYEIDGDMMEERSNDSHLVHLLSRFVYKDKESETESTKNINKNVSGNKSSSDLVKVYGATPNSDGSSNGNGNGNGTGADGEYSDSSSSLSVLSKHMRPLCSAPTYASVLHQYAKLLTRHLLYEVALRMQFNEWGALLFFKEIYAITQLFENAEDTVHADSRSGQKSAVDTRQTRQAHLHLSNSNSNSTVKTATVLMRSHFDALQWMLKCLTLDKVSDVARYKIPTSAFIGEKGLDKGGQKQDLLAIIAIHDRSNSKQTRAQMQMQEKQEKEKQELDGRGRGREWGGENDYSKSDSESESESDEAVVDQFVRLVLARRVDFAADAIAKAKLQLI